MSGRTRYPAKRDPFSSHSLIAGELRGLARRRHAAGMARLLVVDAGCGSGPIAELIGIEPLSVVGFDSDEVGLAVARQHGTLAVAANMREGTLPALLQSADVLVCADVLEHFQDPGQLLQRLMARYLAPGGTVIISVPNVAHVYVRMQLAMGRWDYTERGILDRTHMRFFTRRSARALLDEAGVVSQRELATPIPLPVVNPAFASDRSLYWIHALSAAVTRLWPSLLSYQYVFIATWRGHDRAAAG